MLLNFYFFLKFLYQIIFIDPSSLCTYHTCAKWLTHQHTSLCVVCVLFLKVWTWMFAISNSLSHTHYTHYTHVTNITHVTLYLRLGSFSSAPQNPLCKMNLATLLHLLVCKEKLINLHDLLIEYAAATLMTSLAKRLIQKEYVPGPNCVCMWCARLIRD